MGKSFPFSAELVNLATGQVATDEEASDLLFPREKGFVALREFVETRLITGCTNIYGLMKRLMALPHKTVVFCLISTCTA